MLLICQIPPKALVEKIDETIKDVKETTPAMMSEVELYLVMLTEMIFAVVVV